MSKDKTPLNDNNQAHGYWERYRYKNKLAFKCVFINGKIIGLDEHYWNDGKIRHKRYHL